MGGGTIPSGKQNEFYVNKSEVELDAAGYPDAVNNSPSTSGVHHCIVAADPNSTTDEVVRDEYCVGYVEDVEPDLSGAAHQNNNRAMSNGSLEDEDDKAILCMGVAVANGCGTLNGSLNIVGDADAAVAAIAADSPVAALCIPPSTHPLSCLPAVLDFGRAVSTTFEVQTLDSCRGSDIISISDGTLSVVESVTRGILKGESNTSAPAPTAIPTLSAEGTASSTNSVLLSGGRTHAHIHVMANDIPSPASVPASTSSASSSGRLGISGADGCISDTGDDGDTGSNGIDVTDSNRPGRPAEEVGETKYVLVCDAQSLAKAVLAVQRPEGGTASGHILHGDGVLHKKLHEWGTIALQVEGRLLGDPLGIVSTIQVRGVQFR